MVPIFVADYTFADKLNEFARMNRYQHNDDRIMELVTEGSEQGAHRHLPRRPAGLQDHDPRDEPHDRVQVLAQVEILPGWNHTFTFTPSADQPLI